MLTDDYMDGFADGMEYEAIRNKNTINIGDVVVLKSGSTKMTVSSSYKPHDKNDTRIMFYCDWFSGLERQSAIFDIRTLKKVT